MLALGLIALGDVIAWGVQSSWGSVEVRDVRWTGSTGSTMSALLYVPSRATRETPAPGVVAIHGYINSRETQGGYAVELSRRGFVVLAVDQTGHGYSDPPSGSNGFGGPDALAYLRSLDFVDPDNVGLEGHSMGGWAVLNAAGGDPDGYRSVVLQGSSTGTAGAPDGTRAFPRNLSVVFSEFDEFSGLMWGSPVAGDVPGSDKLMGVFGVDEPVEPGRVYGSIEDGTARILHQPPVTHPGDHLSRAAIGHAVEWFQATLEGGEVTPATDQVWYWKELATLTSAVGMILLLLAAGGRLLALPFFAVLAREPVATRGARGPAWWGAALVFVLLPPLVLFPFKDVVGRTVPVSAWFPQSITTQVAGWAVLVGVISLALFALWHRSTNRGAADAFDAYGVTWSGRWAPALVLRSVLLALAIVATGYATLALSSGLLNVDYRFWVFAIKPMSGLHLRIALSYVVPFTAFFWIYGVVLNGQLRVDDRSPGREMLAAVALSVVGFALLLVYQYSSLFAGGTLRDPSEPLWTIIAFQFLPIMSIAAVLTVYFFRRTGTVYVGATVCGLLVTWIVVASQATHYPF